MRAQRGAVGPQVRRAGERQPVEQPGQRIGQHVDRDRDAQAGEQQHRQRGLLARHGQADQQLAAEQQRHHGRRREGPQHVGPQRLALVERIPDRDRDAKQCDVESGGRQRQPARHQPERDDQDRVAQREEQRGDDDEASPPVVAASPSTALTIAPNDDSEIAANITQWPIRSGPSTLPAIAAPKRATAATAATSAISPARLRQVSLGRDISSSTANQAMPGTVTR